MRVRGCTLREDIEWCCLEGRNDIRCILRTEFSNYHFYEMTLINRVRSIFVLMNSHAKKTMCMSFVFYIKLFGHFFELLGVVVAEECAVCQEYFVNDLLKQCARFSPS